MEALNKIEGTIKAMLSNNMVSQEQIINIIELVRIYGTIQYTNGYINQLKDNINEIKSNNS